MNTVMFSGKKETTANMISLFTYLIRSVGYGDD